MTGPPESPQSKTWVSGLDPLGPDDTPSRVMPDVRIGPYRLLEKLGEGGMGTEEDPPMPSARLTQSGESLRELAAQRHTDPARLTREVRGELDWIGMKALEKDRTRRYEAASALARDVER
jgi:hypothetical protein